MQKSFDSGAFVKRVGERLVQQFSEARQATSPGTVGAAMETPVRDQLEQLLPKGIAVGSGFVIDSYGGTSRQIDVVLYEKDICPVFSVNNTPDSTYYPCEGVIAVGEVKSALNSSELEDAFAKIESVKRLRRFPTTTKVPLPDSGQLPVIRRSYGTASTPGIVDVTSDRRELDKPKSQIFGFVLAGESRLAADTLSSRFCELTAQHGSNRSPNLLACLDGQMLRWVSLTQRESSVVRDEKTNKFVLRESNTGAPSLDSKWTADDADNLLHEPSESVFGTLLRWLISAYHNGKTSAVSAFDRYFNSALDGSATVATLRLKSNPDATQTIRLNTTRER
ncbi:MAG: hypothetical protein OXM54_04660 [Acidimicrobiaceae bacterium]|nr:hypothetical protein [Acidimicrobiaceae bacterium]